MNTFVPGPVGAPDVEATETAVERLAGLATPPGALGRLGELGTWLAGCQGEVPPRPVDDVRLVIFAGDHGVAAHGVSAFPSSVTPLMVQTFVAGRAGVSALATANGVTVRVLDLAVDCDPAELPAEVVAHRVRRGSGAIHLEDALTADELDQALAVGAAAAEEGTPDLLISGDVGIGNTTPAAALVAAVLGLAAADVTGIGTGIDDDVRRHKQTVIQQALDRTRDRHDDCHGDPRDLLAALGSADLAASTAFIATAARRGVPVLLDGLMAVACALVAERLAPGTAAWCRAGHRSPEPAQALALADLGLEPLLDLGMRLGEGSGAVAAVPLVRASAALLRDVALLADVLPGRPGAPAGVVIPDAWRLAVGTLTAMPVRPPSRVDSRTAAGAVLLAPLAVVPLGIVVTGVLVLGDVAGLAPLATGAMAAVALALGSRAFHLDGLADTADGLTASYDRERTLAVMRTGDTGPAGAAAVALVLVAQVAGLASLSATPATAALAGGLVCLSRWSHVAACRRGVPSAATGLAASYAGALPIAVVIALLLAAGGTATLAADLAGLPWWRGVLGVGLAALATAALVRRAVRRLGRVTGDIMGACIEVGLACLLVAAS